MGGLPQEGSQAPNPGSPDTNAHTLSRRLCGIYIDILRGPSCSEPRYFLEAAGTFFRKSLSAQAGETNEPAALMHQSIEKHMNTRLKIDRGNHLEIATPPANHTRLPERPWKPARGRAVWVPRLSGWQCRGRLRHVRYPGGLDLTPVGGQPVSWAGGPRFCLSNKFPGDANAIGLGTALGEPLLS